MMPGLVGIDLVPMRALPGLEQKVNRRARGAADVRRPERLAEAAALGMRLQAEPGNDVVGVHAGGGTVAFIDGNFEKVANHLASLGRLPRQSWLAKRKSR